MHYFIDCYNWMFRILSKSGNLESLRDTFIEELNKKVELLQLDVTLVFDAQHQMGEGSHHHYHSLEVRFTSKGETADDYIVSRLRQVKDPSHHTVVTSDKDLSRRARLELAKTETVEGFLAWISKRYESKLKQKDELHTPIRKKEDTPPKTEPKVPPTGASFDECYNYYLYNFEKHKKS